MKTKPNEGVVQAVENAVKDTRPPVDFTKEWTNGHKFFTSPESRAFVELLHTEERTRERHALHRNEMSRPRNPLNGDPTPRDSRNDVVMNPKMLHTVKSGGIPLYVEHDQSLVQSVLSRFTPKEPQGKIGVREDAYHVLGNREGESHPAVTEDLTATTRRFHEQKLAKQAEKEKINEYIAREKALRQQKELGRQLKILHRQMEEKEKEMTFIQTQYRI